MEFSVTFKPFSGEQYQTAHDFQFSVALLYPIFFYVYKDLIEPLFSCLFRQAELGPS